MIDFSTLIKTIFVKKVDYQHITEKEKERMFFILNRYMARAIPQNADALNKNGIDTALATDLWFQYAQKTTSIPAWFYPKGKKSNNSTKINDELDEMDKLILEKFFSDDLYSEKEKKKTDDKIFSVKKLKKK